VQILFKASPFAFSRLGDPQARGAQLPEQV